MRDSAIATFQKVRGLHAHGKLDKETFAKLVETGSEPALVEQKIGERDVKGPFVVNMPKDFEHMAELDHLGYRSPLENSRNLATVHLLDGGIAAKPEQSLDRVCALALEMSTVRRSAEQWS